MPPSPDSSRRPPADQRRRDEFAFQRIQLRTDTHDFSELRQVIDCACVILIDAYRPPIIRRERSPCTTPIQHQIPYHPIACWPPSAWLKLPKSWRPASCVSARNSPALYLHPTETVCSTSRPRRAVVVANHAADLEGNDADCKNDHRGRTATAGRVPRRCSPGWPL